MKEEDTQTTESQFDERLQQYMGARYGQRGDTRRRYEDAIRACSDIAYLPKTTSEVAREFGHQPETFRRMMKRHYPEVLAERDRLRLLMGLNKLPPRGVSEVTRAKYEPALHLLRTTDMTLRKAAEATGVSLPSLEQHVLFYHRDLAQERLMRRAAALDRPREPGRLTATGDTAHPRGNTDEYYAEAVTLLTEHPEMTIKQAATQAGLSQHNLSGYMNRWHRDVLKQRESWRRAQTARRQAERQKPSRFERVAEKYAPALPLIEQGLTYREVALQTGINEYRLQWWVRHHHPNLHERARENKWVMLPDGTRISRSSWPRFQEAVRASQTTGEPLKDIALRLRVSVSLLRSYLINTAKVG